MPTAKAIGTLKANKEGHTSTSVEVELRDYLTNFQKNLPAHRLPLSFTYETTGVKAYSPLSSTLIIRLQGQGHE
jgi:hypothetical protein